MKRLIVSLLLLGTVLFICYSGMNFVNDTYDKVIDELILGEEYVKKEDYNTAKQHIKKAEKLDISY